MPQGSLLGPILFILYINDLTSSSNLIKFVIYADDTTLFLASKSVEELYKVANAELTKVANWFHDNRLSLSINKTNYLFFSSAIIEPGFQLLIQDIIIQRKSNCKFLGILLDDKQNWLDHLNMLNKKLACNIAMLQVAKSCLPKQCLITLYHMFFQSHLFYAILYWS